MPTHLIVSDIDGTFITSAERVTPRLRDAVTHAATKDAELVLATGRPPRWIYPVLDQLPICPICICVNGAVLYDSDTDRVVTARTLPPATLTRIMQLIDDVLPVSYAVERVGASAFDKCEELFLVTPDFLHLWDSEEHTVVDKTELAAKSAVKLLVRNDRKTAWDLYHLVKLVVPPELAHITFSTDEGLLEISAPQVTKAAGLMAVAQFYGVPASDVVAFGDMPNDIEMLQWAGLGVAMGNADERVKVAADEITTSNDDFGVARVLERLFP